MSTPETKPIEYASRENEEVAAALREIAARLNATAKRYEKGSADPLDVDLRDVVLWETAAQAGVLKFVKANYGKLGDISFAWCLVDLILKAHGALKHGK